MKQIKTLIENLTNYAKTLEYELAKGSFIELDEKCMTISPVNLWFHVYDKKTFKILTRAAKYGNKLQETGIEGVFEDTSLPLLTINFNASFEE